MAILRLGERLVRAGVLSEEQLEIALAQQKRDARPLGALVVSLGFGSAKDVSRVVAEMAGTEYVALEERVLDESLAEVVDEGMARERHLVPIERDGSRLTVALVNPLDIITVDKVREATRLDIHVVVSTDTEITEAQDKLYGKVGHRNFDAEIEAALEAVQQGDMAGNRELRPVMSLVENILAEGVRRRATDIHIEPEEHSVRIRYRVDGTLVQGPSLPVELKNSVAARLKIVADLDISESRKPQDGRIRMEVSRRSIDLRMSTMPCVHGENIVLRILEKSNVVRGLESIGMPKDVLENFKALLATHSGMILVTGPTGSGKTTTLYSALTALDATRDKIATLEDPVEYELPMIRQSQIAEKAGFGFAGGLRALLRQDPDIIFVGEMRDLETAEIAVRAALTGHMVMSTLHTTSALGTLPRLMQMGLPVDLLCTSIRGLMAQRLVRVVCASCSEPDEVDPLTWRRLGRPLLEGANLRKGAGCASCSGTGMRGRIGIYELVRMTPAIAEALANHASVPELMRVAAREGTRFLREDGLAKAFAGITTLEEVLRATADIGIEDSESQEAALEEALAHA